MGIPRHILEHEILGVKSGVRVDTVNVSGSSQLSGNIVFIPGSNTTLTQSGQNITFRAKADKRFLEVMG